MPRGWYHGWRAVVARLDLMAAPAPSVPRKFRLATNDRPAARRAFDQVLDWPIEKLIFAHGRPVTNNAHQVARAAFTWLLGPG